jgi:vacuolar-type H+-ATPase subunit C/Vma6
MWYELLKASMKARPMRVDSISLFVNFLENSMTLLTSLSSSPSKVKNKSLVSAALDNRLVEVTEKPVATSSQKKR